MHELEISVWDAANRRELRLLDIRSRSERWSGIGVIPGSVSPRDGLDSEVRAHLRNGVPVVLCCMSGRRSLVEVERLAERSVFSLAGGMLAWQADGLPAVATAQDFNPIVCSSAAPPELASLRRALMSCFVAEVAETAAGAINPLPLLEECFALVGVDAEEATVGDLVGVVEWAAARSRELGNDYDRIAENMQSFLEQMQPLAAGAGS